ncbi:RING finger protein 122-like [Babylonia areolata]|uniref:RING finger protein 122-like n=1 Tax=Babylonia areolata TaxID=304850 RepID=UPI003FD12560
MDSNLTNPAISGMSARLLEGARQTLTANLSHHDSGAAKHLGLQITSLSFNTSLPLLGLGFVTLVLSLCFCCYLWKLKRDSRTERGYSQLKFNSGTKKVKNDMCPVCLEEFEQAEKVAVSRCHHGFHTKCLQQWLAQHNTCPMCKCQVGTSGQAGERTGLITSNV